MLSVGLPQAGPAPDANQEPPNPRTGRTFTPRIGRDNTGQIIGTVGGNATFGGGH